jgi:predicted metal-dependent RNase
MASVLSAAMDAALDCKSCFMLLSRYGFCGPVSSTWYDRDRLAIVREKKQNRSPYRSRKIEIHHATALLKYDHQVIQIRSRDAAVI